MLSKIKSWFSQPQDALGAAVLLGVVAYVLVAHFTGAAINLALVISLVTAGLGAIGISTTGAVGGDILAAVPELLAFIGSPSAVTASALIAALQKIYADTTKTAPTTAT